MNESIPEQESLFVSAEKIYPRSIVGPFSRARIGAVLVLLGLFYGVAWIQFDGQQWLLFDLPARKFHIFGLVLFPQDFLLLTFLLIIAALSLFFFTALAGRMWCGYACPQTVWTEVFLWMEMWVEGDRRARMKLDKQPWGAEKAAKKLTKHAMWGLFSLWTGFTFVGYFTPIRELGVAFTDFSLGGWEIFWIIFYGFATYGNAGWMREQVCMYMCPYARFQSAMFDSDTLIVTYDERRGEPRGSRKRGADRAELQIGDCIDCTLCVQVCPTGIDIRDGLQYQCIACAACVDVCDTVMDRMGYPRGLVRYGTQSQLEDRPARILRPRLFVYATILAVFVSMFFYALGTRSLLEVDVIRDRKALYREAPGGRLENVYTLRLINKDTVAHQVDLRVNGLATAVLHLEDTNLVVEPTSVLSISARVTVDSNSLESSNSPFEFLIRSRGENGFESTTESRFLGPSAE